MKLPLIGVLGFAVSAGIGSGLLAQLPDDAPLPVPPPVDGAAEPAAAMAFEPLYGLIAADSVRLRGGPADWHGEVLRLERGDVIHLVARNGAWYEVRVPGGFACFARKRGGGREFIEERTPGEGLVLVDDLSLRAAPAQEQAALGKLKANERVIILSDEDGDWLRLLAPADETLFVHESLVTQGEDQESLARDFDLAAEQRHERLVAEGALSRKAAQARQEARRLTDLLAALDARLARAGRSADQLAELRSLRSDYERLAAGAPADSPVRARAEAQIATVKEREGSAETMARAAVRIKELEESLQKNESRYAEQLEQYRQKKASAPEAAKSRFLEYGIGFVRKDVVTELGNQVKYTLHKGGQRHYFLVSDRYNLDDYLSKSVGITAWTVEDPGSQGLRTIIVTRLEILE